MKKLDRNVTDDALFGVFLQERRREGGVTQASAPPKPPRATLVSTPMPEPEPPRVAELQAQLAQSHQTVADLTAQVGKLTAQLAQEREAHAVAQSERATLDQARRDADRRQQALLDRAKRAEQSLAAAETRTLWQDRGLSPTEVLDAFTRLAVGLPKPLWEALSGTDPSLLTALLNDRLVLLCGAPTCTPPTDAVVFPVAPERCELCGGSDLLAAFRQFAAAVERAGLPAVTFVGGSPAYREKLRLLYREVGPRFTIDVVERKRPGESKRAQGKRGLILIWGGSEVDHDTTIHYGDAGDRIARLSHRGLSGLLPRATAFVQGK